MVYGVRFIGKVYYSEWGLGIDSFEEAKGRLENIVRIFGKEGSFRTEIFEKKGSEIVTLESYDYTRNVS